MKNGGRRWGGLVEGEDICVFTGVTRMLDNCVALPLSLFCQPWVPAKSALHKVQLTMQCVTYSM